MNLPIFISESVLDLSKITKHYFYYDYMIPTCIKKATHTIIQHMISIKILLTMLKNGLAQQIS